MIKTVAYQVLLIFIYIVLGFILKKSDKISDKGTKDITNILLTLVTPCVLISSYQEKISAFSPQLIKGLLIAALLSFLVQIITISIPYLFFHDEKRKVSIFASAYSNCGFMAIPLLSSVLGSDGVFYGAIYLALFTLLYWTHGVYLYTGDKKSISAKSLLLNPGVIGAVLALLLFFLKIELPNFLSDTVKGVAALNSPLSMLILGTYLAKVDMKKALSRLSLYKVVFIRLLLSPMITILLLTVAKIVFKADNTVLLSVLIPASAPAAAVSALFAHRFGEDATYASELVAISTLLSIGTMPLMIYISEFFIK